MKIQKEMANQKQISFIFIYNSASFKLIITNLFLGITTVLTLSTISLDSRTDLPKVHYATALDWFILMSFGYCIATLLQFAAVHYFTKVKLFLQKYLLLMESVNPVAVFTVFIIYLFIISLLGSRVDLFKKCTLIKMGLMKNF